MCDIKYCLSFDCADRTLGVCLIGFLPLEDISNRIEVVNDETTYKAYHYHNLLNDILHVKECWLFDLLPEGNVRNTDDSVRLSRLKAALCSIKLTIASLGIKLDEIHVEYQMGQNDLTRLISPAIIYEFCGPDNNIKALVGPCVSVETQATVPKVVVIMPSGKNSIHFKPELAYGVFAAKYKTTKTANKHHTAENFKYFLRMQNALVISKKINYLDINHSVINHVADAFMQSVYKIMHEDWA
jgi:hypothetical protein